VNFFSRVDSLNKNLREEVSNNRHLKVFDQDPYQVIDVDEYDRTQTEEVRKFLQTFKQDPTSNEKTPTPPSNSEWWRRLWRGGKKKSKSKKNKTRSKKMKTKSRSSSRR
jgi:hypothetical protein